MTSKPVICYFNLIVFFQPHIIVIKPPRVLARAKKIGKTWKKVQLAKLLLVPGPKLRNNYELNVSFYNSGISILDFSLMLPVKLSLLIFFASFLASVLLCFFSWLLSLKLSLSNYHDSNRTNVQTKCKKCSKQIRAIIN